MNFPRRLLFGRSVALRRLGNAAILALRETEFFGQINPATSVNPIIHTEGRHDNLPAAAFYFTGSIEEIRRAAGSS
jgi:hypothetical protein